MLWERNIGDVLGAAKWGHFETIRQISYIKYIRFEKGEFDQQWKVSHRLPLSPSPLVPLVSLRVASKSLTWLCLDGKGRRRGHGGVVCPPGYASPDLR